MNKQSCNNFRNILIAVDGSRPAQWAVRAGKCLAAELGARIMVVHVLEPLIDAGDGSLYLPEVEQIRQAQGRKLLADAVSCIPAEQQVETKLLSGHAAQQITAAANQWPADLIVMGTRGNGRFAQLIMGSTASAVIRQATCPVISVAHEFADLKPAEAEWVGVGSDCADPLEAHCRK